MTQYEALGIVLDLAAQNQLDPESPEVEEHGLVEQATLQQEALAMVEEMFHHLEME